MAHLFIWLNHKFILGPLNNKEICKVYICDSYWHNIELLSGGGNLLKLIPLILS